MLKYPEKFFEPRPYNELITPGQSVEEINKYFPPIMRCGNPLDYDQKTQKHMKAIAEECWWRMKKENDGEGYYSICLGDIPSLDKVDTMEKVLSHCPLLRHIDFWQRHGFLQYSANLYITEHIDDGTGRNMPYQFPAVDESKYPYIVNVNTKTASGSEIIQACREKKRRELAFDFPAQDSKKWLLHIDIRVYNFKQVFWEKYIKMPQYAGEIVTLVWTAAARIHKEQYLRSYQYFLKTLQYNCPVRKELMHYVGHDDTNRVYLNLPKTKEWKEEFYKKEIEDAKNGILRTGGKAPILSKKQEEVQEAEMRKNDEAYDAICELADMEAGRKTEVKESLLPKYKDKKVTKVSIDKDATMADITDVLRTVLSNVETKEEPQKTETEKAVENIAKKNAEINTPEKLDPQFMGELKAKSNFARKMSPYHIQDVKEYCKDTIDNMLHICDIVLGAEIPDNVSTEDAEQIIYVDDDIAEDGWHIDTDKCEKAQEALKYIDRPFNSSLYLMAHGNTEYTQEDVDKENTEIKSMLESEKQVYNDYINNDNTSGSGPFDGLIDTHSVYALTEEQLNAYRKKQQENTNNAGIPLDIRYNNNYDVIYHIILESTSEFVTGNDSTNSCYLYIKTEQPFPGYSPVINALLDDEDDMMSVAISVTAYFDKINGIVYLKVPDNIVNRHLKPQPYYNTVQITKAQYQKFIARSVTNRYIYKTSIIDDDNIYVYTPRKDSRTELHSSSASDDYG